MPLQTFCPCIYQSVNVVVTQINWQFLLNFFPGSMTVANKACIVAALPTCNSLCKLVSITLQEGITHPEADCILSFPLGEHKMPSKLLVKCL